MMFDAIGRLQAFGHVRDYGYVGFGSPFFTDFLLLHRQYGITKMTNVEMNVDDEARFRFNRPFKCIDLKFGHSNDELPKLPWIDRTICWLDYDKRLAKFMFDDVRTFALNAASGSALFVTANCAPLNKGLEQNQEPNRQLRNSLARTVGIERVPPNLTVGAVADWGTAALYHAILNDVVKEAVTERNTQEPSPRDRVEMHQVFHFHYEDGAKMMTVGWVLATVRDRPKFRKCRFHDLTFARSGKAAFAINAPVLTTREMRALDSLLPLANEKRLRPAWLPETDVKAFREVYRYYPTYAPMEL